MKANGAKRAGWIEAGKALLLLRAQAHREFCDELERISQALTNIEARPSQKPTVLAAWRLLRASGEDTHAMAAKFQARSQSMRGPAKDKIFKGMPGAHMHWLAAEYRTFAEEVLWLLRRSTQCFRDGTAADWKTLPQPRYRIGFGLSDIGIVESVRLGAERELPSGDELVTLKATLVGLISRHREVQSDYESLATRNKRGRPRGNGSANEQPPDTEKKPKPLTGRALAIQVLERRAALLDLEVQDNGVQKAAAMRALAEEVVAAGLRRGEHFGGVPFEAAVRSEERRMQQALSYWRVKVARAGRPYTPERSTGLDLQERWTSADPNAPLPDEESDQ